MTFKEIVSRWNGGVTLGSARRFAKKIGVDESVVGKWVNGKGKPGEKNIPIVLKELRKELIKLTLEELMDSFQTGPDSEDTIQVKKDFSVEEWELLQKIKHEIRAKEGLVVKPADVFRRLVRLYGGAQWLPTPVQPPASALRPPERLSPKPVDIDEQGKAGLPSTKEMGGSAG